MAPSSITDSILARSTSDTGLPCCTLASSDSMLNWRWAISMSFSISCLATGRLA